MSVPLDFDTLVDLLEDGMLILQLGRTVRPLPQILRVNRRFAELTGFSRTSLEGRSLRVLRGASVSREQFTRIVETLIRRERTEITLALRAAGGSDRMVTCRLQYLPARDDLVVLWVRDTGLAAGGASVGTDLLGAARTLATLTDECFYVLRVGDDLRLTLSWIDERSADLLGFAADELIQTGGFASIIAERDRRSLRQHNQRLIAGETSSITYRIRTRSGALRWVRDRGRQLRSLESGLVSEIVGSLAPHADDLPRATGSGRLERMAAAMAAQLHMLVCLVNDRGEIAWTSSEPATPMAEAVRRVLGFDPTTAPEDRLLDEWLDLVDAVFAEGEAAATSLSWPSDDGTLPVEVALTPIEDSLALAVFRPAADAAGAPIMTLLSSDELMRSLDLAGVPALLLARSGEILRIGRAARPGLSDREAKLRIGARLQDLVDGETARRLEEALGRTTESRQTVELSLDLAAPAADGSPLVWRLLAVSQAGRTAILATGQTEQDGASRQTRQLAEARLEALIRASHDALLLLDASGTVIALNAAAEAVFGRRRDEITGARIDMLLRSDEARDRPLMERLLRAAPEGTQRREFQAIRPQDELIAVELTAQRVEHADRGELVVAVRDLSARRATEETLRYLAYYDMLTGLPNRRLFEDRLRQTIEQARQTKGGFAVLLLDLDRFRLINDSLGIAKADAVLSGIAGRLAGLAGDADTVARFGADEFIILSAQATTPEAAAKAAGRLLEGLRAPVSVEDQELTIACSIGIALHPADGAEPDALIKNAIAALARAKEHGRNRFQFYTDDMNASAFQRLMLETRLRRALDQGELVLYYQPQVLVADGAVIGAEALLRWFHPEIGLVPPADFIPLAEETGLIVPMGAWVLEVACRQAERWQRELGRPEFRISVNLSARQFEHKDLVTTIAEVLDRTGLAPSTLDLEITESVVMHDADDAVRRLGELTALGVSLAIDDFGTGYSSLAYLRRFPIHRLKIDRSFTTDIERDANSATIAQAIIALGRSLSLRVVAEGVETQAQLDLLRGFGCDEVQGFFLCRPLPADEVAQAIGLGRLPARAP